MIQKYSVHLSPEAYEHVRIVAFRDRKPMQEIVSETLVEVLSKKLATAPVPDPKDRELEPA